MMDQHLSFSLPTLREALEIEFSDLTKTHLQYWRNLKNRENEETLFFADEHQDPVLQKLSRHKRSGIERILQVRVLFYHRNKGK